MSEVKLDPVPDIPGLVLVQTPRLEDERGWFMEIQSESLALQLGGDRFRQTNLSRSREGVIRGLHYHERGQNDLFFCIEGTARVVILDRETARTFSLDIGDENPVAIYIPGRHAHGFEALTDLIFCYHVTQQYDPEHPDEHELPWDDPRVVRLWRGRHPILSARDSSKEGAP